MNVADIITNLKNLTLIGNTNAAQDTVKLVDYINMAYRRVYDRVVREYPFISQTTQTVTITDGAGTLSPVPHFILSVVDTGNNYKALTPTDVLDVENGRPELDEEASAQDYWVEGFASIKTYPKSSTTLRVRYVPIADALASDTVEASILFPPMFHDILVWETAMLIAYDERDKIVGAELNYTEERARTDWARLQSWLRLRAPRKEPRVRMPGFHAN